MNFFINISLVTVSCTRDSEIKYKMYKFRPRILKTFLQFPVFKQLKLKTASRWSRSLFTTFCWLQNLIVSFIHFLSDIYDFKNVVKLHLFFTVVNSYNYSYETKDPNGPLAWPQIVSACGGKLQSPIDINWLASQYYTSSDSKLQINNVDQKPSAIQVNNNGKGGSFTFTYGDDASPSNITGGPLGSRTFIFHSFHLHWPSEHTFNKVRFAAELHLVHYNSKYESREEASSKIDGLAVLGFVLILPPIFIQTNLPFIKFLANVTEYESSYVANFNLFTYKDLIAEYFVIASYPGSLTSPGCSENVMWMMASTPLFISENELDLLRQLKQSNSQPLMKNSRPIQNSNGRQPRIFLTETKSNKC